MFYLHMLNYSCVNSYLFNRIHWLLVSHNITLLYLLSNKDVIRAIFIISSTFRRKKVELLSSLRCQRQHLGRLSFRLSFLSVHFSKTIKGIHLKLGILVHYQKRNQLQQGRWPCDLYIQIYLPLFWHSTWKLGIFF